MLNLTDLKPLGAFLEYTIRPLIDEWRWLLNELAQAGLPITEKRLRRVLHAAARVHIQITLIRAVEAILIIALLCGTTYALFRPIS